MLVPSGLVEKAGLQKIDMSDNILISRKISRYRDFENIKNSILVNLSKKPPKSSSISRRIHLQPSTFPMPPSLLKVDQLHIDEPTHRKQPIRHWPYAEDDRLCGGAYNCGTPRFLWSFFRETVRYKGGGR